MAPVGVEGRAPEHPRSTENSITFIKLLTDFWSMVVDIHRTHVSVRERQRGSLCDWSHRKNKGCFRRNRG